jgi:hypothetical protein
MAYQSELHSLFEELKRLKFREGYLTAQIEHHVRMLGVLEEDLVKIPEESSPGPKTYNGSCASTIWSYLSDGHSTFSAEIYKYATGKGFTRQDIRQALKRFRDEGYIIRNEDDSYSLVDNSQISLRTEAS